MKTQIETAASLPERDQVSTIEAARILGLAVRSVQLMVDRGELQAWKTPGGHRRISRDSINQWRDSERTTLRTPNAADAHSANTEPFKSNDRTTSGGRVLLIEDSTHFQNLVKLLLAQGFPNVELKVASDAISGLAMTGEFQPDVLLVDILLPGIDGATLITSLRSNPRFQAMQLIVITSLDARQLAPYAFALQGVQVIHKPKIVAELPALLAQKLGSRNAHGGFSSAPSQAIAGPQSK